MADLLQALADGLYNVLLILETFLDTLSDIPFIDSGFSLLELFYAVALLGFLINLFRVVVTPEDELEEIKISDEIDAKVTIGI